MTREEEIYEVNNPRWLADTFVFSRKKYKIFTGEQLSLICYIKVNHYNKIEEIGSCFEERFQFKTENYPLVLNREDVRVATSAHRKRFNSIGSEYWIGLWNSKNQIKLLRL